MRQLSPWDVNQSSECIHKVKDSGSICLTLVCVLNHSSDRLREWYFLWWTTGSKDPRLLILNQDTKEPEFESSVQSAMCVLFSLWQWPDNQSCYSHPWLWTAASDYDSILHTRGWNIVLQEARLVNGLGFGDPKSPHERCHGQKVNKWRWFCSNTNLFVKTGSRLDLACAAWCRNLSRCCFSKQFWLYWELLWTISDRHLN